MSVKEAIQAAAEVGVETEVGHRTGELVFTYRGSKPFLGSKPRRRLNLRRKDSSREIVVFLRKAADSLGVPWTS